MGKNYYIPQKWGIFLNFSRDEEWLEGTRSSTAKSWEGKCGNKRIIFMSWVCLDFRWVQIAAPIFNPYNDTILPQIQNIISKIREVYNTKMIRMCFKQIILSNSLLKSLAKYF